MPGMPAQPSFGGQQYNPNQMFQTEKNELKIYTHLWIVENSDTTLLKKWKKNE